MPPQPEPPGGTSGKHPPSEPFPILVAPSTSGKGVNTIREELITVACWKLNDVRFVFGSSFVLPQTRGEFLELLQLRKEHPGCPLSIFGHADPVGNDVFNKQLSGNRAEAIYGALVRDVDLWEQLYKGAGNAEGWGITSIQHMLTALGFNPGPVTGSLNATTKAAVQDFQSKNELTPDGNPGSKTRAKLFAAYMAFLCPDKLEKTEFLSRGDDPKGKGDYQGCSEFNPVLRFSQAEEKELQKPANKSKRDEENSSNRRVMALFYRAGTRVLPKDWPCPRSNEPADGCKKRFFSDGEKRRSPQAERREFSRTQDTFACRFYQRMVEVSPCEGIIIPPIPVLDGVSPIIFFLETAGASTVGVKHRVVLVEKPHTSAAVDEVDVELTTDIPFDGAGTFTAEPAGKVKFFRSGKQLQFDGKDNVFTGAELTSKVSLRCEGVQASAAIDDVRLKLTLAGGSKKRGGPAEVALTVVEVTLDICEPRTSPAAEPPALAQPSSNTPPPAPPPKDKFFGGRAVQVQNAAKAEERAILIVRKILPATFNGSVVLTRAGDNAVLFAAETPTAGEVELAARIVFPASEIQAAEKRFFVEGKTPSGALRDTRFQLGVEGFDEDADAVTVTAVEAEIVSDVKLADLKFVVDRAPEKPERVTKSPFFAAPLIVGVKYDVRLRPFVAPPGGTPVKLLSFQWSSPIAAASLKLEDITKEVVKLQSLQNSAAADDFSIDVIVETEIGKFRKSHKFTSVTVEIDSVINGEQPVLASDINFIRNPAVTVLFATGAATDTKEAATIEITKITPALGLTADDARIAWWIVGGEPKGAAKYEGKALFLNSDAAKYGLKVQIAGQQKGDVLVQPYSGGFPYGMFRTRVEPLHRIKYRVNRVLTALVPASGSKPAIPARIPTASHADAKKHIRMCNLYLRQMGIEVVPDDSAAVPTDAGNDIAGLKGLDKFVVSAVRVEAGHFDVTVNRQEMTFQVTGNNGDQAIEVNGRNEVLVFAYMHSLLQTKPGILVLAQAQRWPHNHAPETRKDPPASSTFTLPDSGIPSTSLIPKTGIPGDTPAGTVKLDVIPKSKLFVKFRSSQKKRHEDLMWGIAVPTTTMDTFSTQTFPASPETVYGVVLAHEVGHALGLNHRIADTGASGDPFPDTITIPSTKNVMFPSINFPTGENFDLIQARAVRFSEILFRNP